METIEAFQINVGQGRVALVDNEDEEIFRFSTVKWRNRRDDYSRERECYYVRREVVEDDTKGILIPPVELARVVARLDSLDGQKLSEGRLQFVDHNPLNCCRDNLTVERYGKKFNVGARLRYCTSNPEVKIWQ